MDQTEQNQSPFPANPSPRSGNVGPLAAAVVIVVLLAAAGFYFFYSQQQSTTTPDTQAVQSNAQDQNSAIESDLNATQTSGADADVSNLNDSL